MGYDNKGKNNPMYGVHRFGKDSPRWRGGGKAYYGKMAHKICAEYWNIKIPRTLLVHHVDKDYTNNNIWNLALITPSLHRRIHSGIPPEQKRENINRTKRAWYSRNKERVLSKQRERYHANTHP